MAVLKLSLDDFFEEEEFTLIAIHCVLEHYRVAYLINKHLNISLKRDLKDVKNSKLNTEFALFEYLDVNTDNIYNLVANQCKMATEKTDRLRLNNLFSEEKSINDTTYYLIPEQKKVSYFLKIDAEFTTNKTQVILNKILEIPQIITAYYVDANNLKSKNNLIFY